MLFSVEQAFVGRDETRAPLKTPAWEATAEPKWMTYKKQERADHMTNGVYSNMITYSPRPSPLELIS